jgi:hypothetical protein
MAVAVVVAAVGLDCCAMIAIAIHASWYPMMIARDCAKRNHIVAPTVFSAAFPATTTTDNCNYSRIENPPRPEPTV